MRLPAIGLPKTVTIVLVQTIRLQMARIAATALKVATPKVEIALLVELRHSHNRL